MLRARRWRVRLIGCARVCEGRSRHTGASRRISTNIGSPSRELMSDRRRRGGVCWFEPRRSNLRERALWGAPRVSFRTLHAEPQPQHPPVGYIDRAENKGVDTFFNAIGDYGVGRRPTGWALRRLWSKRNRLSSSRRTQTPQPHYHMSPTRNPAGNGSVGSTTTSA